MDSEVSNDLDELGARCKRAQTASRKLKGDLTGAGKRRYTKLRILTSFPGLVDLAAKLVGIDELPYSWDDHMKCNWHKTPGNSAIAKNLDMVTNDSAKFRHLCENIKEDRKDWNDRPEKFLVMTKHPVTVFILSLVSPCPIS